MNINNEATNILFDLEPNDVTPVFENPAEGTQSRGPRPAGLPDEGELPARLRARSHRRGLSRGLLVSWLHAGSSGAHHPGAFDRREGRAGICLRRESPAVTRANRQAAPTLRRAAKFSPRENGCIWTLSLSKSPSRADSQVDRVALRLCLRQRAPDAGPRLRHTKDSGGPTLRWRENCPPRTVPSCTPRELPPRTVIDRINGRI